ncbi:ADP-ribosylation factor-binding protein GGA3a [Chanos chanos]|uniref:ADP-ribosylation factor-binding protein GGA3a n=1 Tax=Chanos chanos TaxID=29144 RepID=A0A6J2VZD6_CHACN|nr:ADP-ribosylation factor-binding protein GGA3-like [Chanos chanos]
MADPEGESLESWLNKATNPSNRQEDWEYIIGFCDQINKELEGPQIAVRLLAHKIQSPQEWEAVQALTVLEACMKNCGRRFHNEVGKFRFLNELIKVVSPKYLGDRVSEKVKTKVIELLFSWSVALPDEAKITEAYQMLKRQGIVTVDPEVPADKTLIPSPARPKNPAFENEEKNKRLAELLKSKKPEDLQEANRIIKSMVKEDEVRMQKESKRVGILEEANNSVKLLNEMLSHFSKDESTQADKELIKDLYNDCDKLRTAVFKLATETEDNDSSLGDILQASDDLSRVINSYKKIVEGQNINGGTPGSSSSECTNDKNSSEILIDLTGLDAQSPSPSEHRPPSPPRSDSIPADLFMGPQIPVLPPPTVTPSSGQTGGQSSERTSPNQPAPHPPSTSFSLLDEELLSLGLSDQFSLSSQTEVKQKKDDVNRQWTSLQASDPAFDLLGSSSLLEPVASNAPASSESTSKTESVPYQETPGAASLPFPRAAQSLSASLNQDLQDLALLDLGNPDSAPGLMGSGSLFAMGEGGVSATSSAAPPPPAVPSVKAPPAGGFHPDSPVFRSLSPVLSGAQSGSPASSEISLANLFVPLETIKPSKICPVTAYDKDGVRVLLHFATECPPGRPDVLVVVVSMLNTAPLPVKNVLLQAAVPKSMKLKLQPPSGTELVPFNPILPPSAITQVMLLANPLKEKVRMRYKMTFTLGERQCTDVGELDNFPPVENWGCL